MDDAFPWLKKRVEHCKSVDGDTECTEYQISDYRSKKKESKIYKQSENKENGDTSKDILELKNLITHQQIQLQTILRNQAALQEEIRCLARQGL